MKKRQKTVRNRRSKPPKLRHSRCHLETPRLLYPSEFDPQKRDYAKYEVKTRWHHLAVYLFWAECGYVGSALPFFFSRIDERIDRMRKDPPDTDRVLSDVEKETLKQFEAVKERSFPRRRSP